MTTILYIAGYGRSGSTILDKFLGAHPEIVSGGEMFRAPEIFTDDAALCTCGATFRDCAVWRGYRADVMRVAAEFGGMSELRRALAGVEGRAGLGHAAPNHWQTWQALAGRGVAAIAAAKPAAKFVVDSSKTARGAAARPLCLSRAGHDLRVILLSRRISGVLASVRKGRNRDIEAGRPGGRLRALPGAALGWILAEAANQRIRRDLPEAASFALSYEALIADPEAEITALAQWLGLDPAPILAAMTTGAEPGHLIGGNRNRFAAATLARGAPVRADLFSSGMAWLARRVGSLGRSA